LIPFIPGGTLGSAALKGKSGTAAGREGHTLWVDTRKALRVAADDSAVRGPRTSYGVPQIIERAA
jgi:hypothetical protein